MQKSTVSRIDEGKKGVFVCVCVRLYLLHTEYKNTHSLNEVRTFWLAHTASKDCLRVKMWFRFRIGVRIGLGVTCDG